MGCSHTQDGTMCADCQKTVLASMNMRETSLPYDVLVRHGLVRLRADGHFEACGEPRATQLAEALRTVERETWKRAENLVVELARAIQKVNGQATQKDLIRLVSLMRELSGDTSPGFGPTQDSPMATCHPWRQEYRDGFCVACANKT